MKLAIAFILLLPLSLMAQTAAATYPAGVDTAAMNKSVDPCVDFYQYACGNWVSTHPLPSDRARYGRFAELQDRNEKLELDILHAAAAGGASRGPIETKIGDYFASCMDTVAIDRKGIAPLQAELDRINAMATGADVVAEVIHLHKAGLGVVFRFGSQPDAKDSNKTIAALSQGGLSLPDRDYYLKDDPKSVEIRGRYLQHIQRMFTLAGDSADAAAAKAKTVLELETAIAKASMDRVSTRDPDKTYHIMTRRQLADLAPIFPWETYFAGIGAPAFETLNVAQPDTIRDVMAAMSTRPVADGKAYFGYQLLRANANELARPFEDEYFDFWQRYLAGVQQPRPREIRCATAADAALGDLLGQKFDDVAFGPDSKTRITQLVVGLEKIHGDGHRHAALDERRHQEGRSDQASGHHKQRRLPREVARLQQGRRHARRLPGQFSACRRSDYRAAAREIGKPTDKSEWSMTTPTVNAFYQPSSNSINFPAGILQFPFFEPKRDMAVNYGGIGVVIGHEMTHGFDDQGRKYDGDGNLRDWWTPQDGAEFEKRAACVAGEYSSFVSVPAAPPQEAVKLNGRLTLGENTADNGGLRIAYMAMEDALNGKSDKIDGLTPEQRFFLGFAQVWCENMSTQELRNRAMTDSHSPGRFRVNGSVQNSPEFQKAFSCKAAQPMVSPNACRVW